MSFFVAFNALAGKVDTVFSQYSVGEELVGFNKINNFACKLVFDNYSDGRTMSLKFKEENSDFFKWMSPSGYQRDYKSGGWFSDYIYTTKEWKPSFGSVLFGSGGRQPFKYTLKVYLNGDNKISHAIYTDDKMNKEIVYCQF